MGYLYLKPTCSSWRKLREAKTLGGLYTIGKPYARKMSFTVLKTVGFKLKQIDYLKNFQKKCLNKCAFSLFSLCSHNVVDISKSETPYWIHMYFLYIC